MVERDNKLNSVVHELNAKARDVEALTSKLTKVTADRDELQRKLVSMSSAYERALGRDTGAGGPAGYGPSGGAGTPGQSVAATVRAQQRGCRLGSDGTMCGCFSSWLPQSQLLPLTLMHASWCSRAVVVTQARQRQEATSVWAWHQSLPWAFTVRRLYPAAPALPAQW